jgi:hypothetical protein
MKKGGRIGVDLRRPVVVGLSCFELPELVGAAPIGESIRLLQMRR